MTYQIRPQKESFAFNSEFNTGGGSIVRGGQELYNRKNERILLLSVNSRRVVYLHLGNGRFYQQSLEGFEDELLYGMYTATGEKSGGAVALTNWAMTILRLAFRPLTFIVPAAEIINGAIQLQASRAQLELSYESMKLSYGNIDKLVPGLLPKIWEAVLDKEIVLLFNPLKHPDVGEWLMAALKIAGKRMRKVRVVTSSHVGDEVSGFFNKSWMKIKSGLKALTEVLEYVIIVTPAIAGSTGIDGPRALQLAKRKLKDINVVEAAAIVLQIKALSSAEKRRLVFEIQDLIKNGSQLISTIKNAVTW